MMSFFGLTMYRTCEQGARQGPDTVQADNKLASADGMTRLHLMTPILHGLGTDAEMAFEVHCHHGIPIGLTERGKHAVTVVTRIVDDAVKISKNKNTKSVIMARMDAYMKRAEQLKPMVKQIEARRKTKKK